MSAIPSAPPKRFAHVLLSARRWVIIAMLLSLHAALVSPTGSDFERIWLLVHFGLFLLWQPFISTDRELNIFAVTLLLGITAAALYILEGWMLVAWLTILIGIMGGKVFTLRAARRSRFYVVALFYLMAILLTWTVPVSLLEIRDLPTGTSAVVTVFLPFVLLLMAFLPYRAEDETNAQVFDFFYSLFIFQLVVVLILGSIAAMRVTQNQYIQAVLLTVFAFALGLFILAVLWAPRAGFGGLRTYFSRYLMSVGMPFELWMRRIAELSDSEINSAGFLNHAMNEVADVPWLLGAKWQSPDGPGRFGGESSHCAQFRFDQLEITFFSETRLSPALLLHLRLLAQVVGEFYEGKRREQIQKQNAYLQAVHETGARLTHDIKNLLQSIYALTSAGGVQMERRAAGLEARAITPYEALLGRQLPELSKRLQTTLDRLRNPEVETADVLIPASEWWRDVNARHAASGVRFLAEGALDKEVPATLFDSFLENCLDNTRKKKEREPEIAVTVTIKGGESISLSVADTGSAIPQSVVENLFRAPVEHARIGATDDAFVGGMGIGLYQVGRQAERLGYALSLAASAHESTRFFLEPRFDIEP